MCRIIEVQSPSSDAAADEARGQNAFKLYLQTETEGAEAGRVPVFSAKMTSRLTPSTPLTTLTEVADDAISAASDDRPLSRPSVFLAKRKNVRFADDCGFSLTAFRVMTEPSDYPPNVPAEILLRHRKAAAEFSKTNLEFVKEEHSEDEGYSSTESSSQIEPFSRAACFRWTVAFPHRRTNTQLFQRTLNEQNVALHNVFIVDSPTSTPRVGVTRLIGTIVVSNVAFEKRVFVRWTANAWASQRDQQAAYLNSPSSRNDTFRFDVNLPAPQNTGGRVEFCVCFVAGPAGAAGAYWDSNEGKNFMLTQKMC